MIRIYIPELLESDFVGVKADEQRRGTIQIVSDGQNFEVIDGGFGKYAARLIKRLKELEIRTPYLHISHGHYDHYNGIERIIDDDWFTPRALYCYDPASLNRNFSKACRDNIEALERIIRKAKARHIDVVFLKDGDMLVHGDIKMVIYREQPETGNNTDEYLNNGSLCYWFPELRYLYTADGPDDISELCKSRKIKPLIIHCPHHGNACTRHMAIWLAENGCVLFWDNDFSTVITDFLATGRKRCIESGMRYLSCHGDINIVAGGGKLIVYKGSEHWSFKCGYNGPLNLKYADLAIVKSVVKGTLGKDDARTTALLDLGYRIQNVQDNVNFFFKMIRG